jgi:hypothetical protein
MLIDAELDAGMEVASVELVGGMNLGMA